MKLFLIHCGFYDKELFDGIYESHGNFFVVAADMQEARVKAKARAEFKHKHMHIDGIQELNVVDGYKVNLERASEDATSIQSYDYEVLKNLSKQIT